MPTDHFTLQHSLMIQWLAMVTTFDHQSLNNLDNSHQIAKIDRRCTDPNNEYQSQSQAIGLHWLSNYEIHQFTGNDDDLLDLLACDMLLGNVRRSGKLL